MLFPLNLQSPARPRDLRLRRSNIHSLRSNSNGMTTIDTCEPAGSTTKRLDLANAQRVVCRKSLETYMILLVMGKEEEEEG